MEPPFPICPACGHRFDTAGIYGPKGDDSDVIAYLHPVESACHYVWARVGGEPEAELIQLGTTLDYTDQALARMVEQSDIVFDLTANRGDHPQSTPVLGRLRRLLWPH
jgi:hypothetical protein